MTNNYNIFLFVYFIFFYLTGQNHLEPALIYTVGFFKGSGRASEIKLLNCEDKCNNNNQIKV